MLRKGDAFGRYVIDGPVGAGGMGEVYDALDSVLHRRVALKLLRQNIVDPSQWADAKTRMLREARAAAALHHPNAVAVYDSGVVDDVPFIAMELVNGVPLRAYVGDRNVPWERKLRWMLDVASALGAAHGAGLVHRDVKPDNILVRPDGHVKVLDFGIARRFGASAGPFPADSATLTGAGQVVGTPNYMAPEQISGKPVDGRADQFAWAVTAYRLLAGTLPWPAHEDPMAVAAAILTEIPAPLAQSAPEVPALVAQVIDRALSYSREDRFESMQEIIALLEPLAAPTLPASLSTPSAQPTGPSRVDRLGRAAATRETTKAVTSDQPTRQDGQPSSVPRWRATRVLPLAALAAVGAALGWGARWQASARSSPAAPAAPVASALPPMPLMDLPRPASNSPGALTLYVAGLQAWHDANADQARSQLLEATKLDASMGPAHLRYALAAFFPSSDGPREHFARATQLRTAMSIYDQALLDAVEPIFDRTPPDWAEADKKLAAATRSLPNDAELYARLAWVRQQVGDLPGILEAANAALAIDPRYASVLLTKADAALATGDYRAATITADQCLAVAPAAAACVGFRMYGEAHDDACAEYEQDARRMIAIDPQSSDGYAFLARASFALGRPVEAVQEALAASWKRLGDDERLWEEDNDRLNLATLLGDAATQDAGLQGMLGDIHGRTEARYHLIPAWTQVLVLTEAGQLHRAAAVAGDFLKRQDVWTKDPGIDGFAVSLDMIPFMLKARLRGGDITASDFEAQRSAWIEGWKKRLSARSAGYLWIYGYAMVTDTADDAAKALAALPAYAPVPEFRPSLLGDAAVGRTLFLGGRVEDAIPILRSAAGNCDVLENPVEWVKASWWLGQALEAKGDVAGACAAYANVVKRWSGLGKRSVTAMAARKKIASLACKASP